MTDEQSFVPQPRRARDIVRDGIILVSMTFVALAVGFGLHLQMGFGFWPAAAAAAAVYLSMLFSHLMLTQNRETAMLRRELVRLNNEVLQLRRTPAEGGVLREAHGSGSAANQQYGYGRSYQPEVTVPLPSVAGPDTIERPRQSPQSQSAQYNAQYASAQQPSQNYQPDSRQRPTAPREEPARGRHAPGTPLAEKRPAPKQRSSNDDAADLISDLSGLQDAAPAPPRPRPSPVQPVVQIPRPSKPIAETVIAVAPAPQPQPVEPVPVAALVAAVVDEPVAAKPEPKPPTPKRTVSTEGDRDVEAIHDLIKKLAADIVGGQAAAPAAATPVRPPVIADKVPPKAADKAPSKPANAGNTNAPKEPVRPPAAASRPAASGRVPIAAAATPVAKPVAKPMVVDPDLAQTLDALPPVRSIASAPAASAPAVAASATVAIAAVAAARTAVEARMAAKSAPAAVAAKPPELPPVVEPPMAVETAEDDDGMVQIGAQLAADLGAREAAELPPELPTIEVPPEQPLEEGLQALKATADAMRAQPTVAALTAALSGATDTDVPPLPAHPEMHDKLALLASVIDEERFDVCLEAIIGLADRRAQHYEVTLRLKQADEDLLGDAMGTGLLPLLDAAVIDQSARIAWKLEDRGRPGSLFSQIAGESLESDRFLNRFADTYRHSETVAARLVLAFVQSDLRTFTDAHWATLRDMADLGFRFSLEEVTDLDLDFEGLKQAGFAFIKLDATVFLHGLPIATGKVPSSHVCRFFEELGLVVIVGRITEEAQYEHLLDAGVGFGQGMLFGEARSVKADVLKGPQRAVA
jgi:cyclic-di-GMP phosphodiesterase, flagellum assembly factor TipF